MTVDTDASGARRISLQQAADRLGVHYMTVYRYIRTGRLPAVKEAGEWRIDRAAVDRLRRRQAGPQSRAPRRTWATSRMLDRLVAGDELGVWQLVESALAGGAEPSEVHLELIVPALRAVGEQWAEGDLSVADEHRASVVARRVISRLGTRFTRRGRNAGRSSSGRWPASDTRYRAPSSPTSCAVPGSMSSTLVPTPRPIPS